MRLLLHGYTRVISPRGEGSCKKEKIMADEQTYTFRCTVCGYEVTVNTPELPEDYVCPECGVGPDMFELVED